ncbi:ABC transporter ATP-binding protein, partial [Tianweitania sp.]|uniref:ABC transporter ATP-binding protein n=1 Tax=Tianweitania sp. TaxID=2021634 RepID=UPI00289A9057
HDLSVVRYIADRVVVMYLGYIVEQGTTDQIFAPPYHPYTEALLSAIPIADTSVVKKHIVLDGDIPSAMNPPTGCPFQTRCRYKSLVPDHLCETQVPPLRELDDGHRSLCWLPDEVLARMEPVISFAAKTTDDPASRAPDEDRALPVHGGHPVEEDALGEPLTPADALDEQARIEVHGSREISALPGESSPEKLQTEAGDGRQAASAEVKPALARTPEEEAANSEGTAQPARPVQTTASPAEARRKLGLDE